MKNLLKFSTRNGGTMSLHSAFIKILSGLVACVAISATSLSAQCCGKGVSHGEPNYYGRPITQWETDDCRYSYNPCYDECAPRPPVACCDWGDIFIGIEGLWWTVYQDNLDYAVEFDPDDADIILGPGHTKFLEYDWTGGGRGRLGFVLWGWNLHGIYTWYQNKSDSSTNTEGSDTDLKASLLHPATPESDAEFASIDSDLNYQTFEILIGRDLRLCENSIVLQPFFGIQGLQIDQELEVDYEGEDFDDPARVKWSSKVDAIGLKAGLDMNYRWYCGFGLYGSFAGSILAGRTDIHHRQQVLDDGDVDETLIDIKEKENVFLPGYQVSAGFSWDTCCGDCFYFIFKLGYEFNHWFHTPQLRRYHDGIEGVSSDASGNIGLQGVTLSLNFYF
jgi:hypothetical protein